MTSHGSIDDRGHEEDLQNNNERLLRGSTKPSMLFIGCHPDDLELGAGGTIARFLDKKHPVRLIYLTSGGFGCNEAQRQGESIKACRALNANRGNLDIVFGPFKDSWLPDDKRLLEYIEKQILAGPECQKQLRFPIFAAFIHSAHDVHQDHQVAHKWCEIALRHVPRVYAFEAPSYTEDFTPTTFVDIAAVIARKGGALDYHKSQKALARPYMEYEAMKNVARFRGLRIGVEFAEAFETLKNQLEP